LPARGAVSIGTAAGSWRGGHPINECIEEGVGVARNINEQIAILGRKIAVLIGGDAAGSRRSMPVYLGTRTKKLLPDGEALGKRHLRSS
jgi:hypothetical protein